MDRSRIQRQYMEPMIPFKLKAPFQPTGDQPKAVKSLVQGLNEGQWAQVLLGATGTGKTFTMAKVIEEVQRPTLIISPNKTLAAQTASEFKDFFPDNAVYYFVSYYDYYQPESYVPQTDTYIEKDSSRNEEIDRLRHSATMALFERKDVIIVASVSCIYGLGDPEDYSTMGLSLRPGEEIDRDKIIEKLVNMQYMRNDMNFTRDTFRVRGDTIDVFPASENNVAVRIEMFGDEVDSLTEFDVLTGETVAERNHIGIFPASHYVTSSDKLKKAIGSIEQELDGRLKELRDQGKLLEAQRLEQRTNYDLEMMQEVGYCSGIENYSRHMSSRKPGEPPYTLLDYFPDDFLIMIDESHVTVPQLRAMYNGDQSRKRTLVDYGFRLPSALDNRPLTFDEFTERINQIIYVSATPGPYEMGVQTNLAEQIIRPTGLLDPSIEVRPIEGQMDDLLGEIHKREDAHERVLITTLTKKMAEDLTDFLTEAGVKVRYLHSDVATIERAEIIRDLRAGVFDVLVGINLLREGLDMPEVSLVAILDADKEGFLRSETSMIQVIGRAARNEHGHVIMYADRVTKSMKYAIDETNRRRRIQEAYNKEHHITPHTVQKRVKDLIDLTKIEEKTGDYGKKPAGKEEMSDEELYMQMQQTEKDMKRAAKSLEFEEAALWRDQLAKLRQMWTDRYGSRADAALKRVSAGKKRINRPMKKRI
ncbi:excinuclease ABC subunit UvrB [uncultured Dialister sp.]|uniref:excinuclease ABC subunit UvrB n=1 Tax=uncultured Dialister sp. TaxID=278064 RepID=UPI00266F88E0|nr:excinuclease ABC subunit UvrB [uncultured Dialister sp.]